MQTRLSSGVAVAVVSYSAAAAPIRPLAQEIPYAAGAVVKRKKKINNFLYVNQVQLENKTRRKKTFPNSNQHYKYKEINFL